MLDDLFTDHLIIILILYLRCIGQSTFTDHESDILASGKDGFKRFHSRFNLFISRILADDEGFDIHILQQFDSHFTLIDMLRLILDAWLSTPSDNKDNRDGIHLVVQQACDRVDDIAFPAVLHIDHGHFSSSEVITRS